MTFLGIRMSEMDSKNADAIELYPGTSQEVKQMMFLSSKGKINVGLALECLIHTQTLARLSSTVTVFVFLCYCG